MTGPDSTDIHQFFMKGTGPMRYLVNDYTDPAHAALTGLDYAHHIPVTTYTGADWDGGMLARISGEEKPKPEKPRRAPRKMPSGWWVIPGLVLGLIVWGAAAVLVTRLF